MKNILGKLAEKYKKHGLTDLSDLLFMFKIRGEPCNIEDHYMFREAYSTSLPKRVLWKVARQLGKTTNAITLPTLLRSILVPNWTSLIVAPRYEQSKRISTDFTDSFLKSSEFKSAFSDGDTRRSVLNKTFTNGSISYYSYAYLDCGRIRGIPGVDQWSIDEVQDMNPDFIPIIRETASASPFGFETFCGTPLTLDAAIEKLDQQGTQSELIFTCPGCKKDNIPSTDYDLLQMIGKTGPICAKCGKKIDIYSGRWVAQFPERQFEMVSRHLSQLVHPLHVCIPGKWDELLYKVNTYATGDLYNEVFGESYDVADKLFSVSDIRAVSQGVSSDIKEARKRASNLKNVTMGVDWTGGGVGSDSRTSLVIGGMIPGSDAIEVVYAEVLPKHLDPSQECAIILDFKKSLRVGRVAHDFGGIGRGLEYLLLQMGMPQKDLIPFNYVISPRKDIVYADFLADGRRKCFNLDKIRSIIVLSSMIKAKKIKLPDWDSQEKRQGGNPFRDLLSIYTEQKESMKGSDLFYIKRSSGIPDDTAHALNLLCTTLWYSQGKYPDVSEALNYKMSVEQIESLCPSNPDWLS